MLSVRRTRLVSMLYCIRISRTGLNRGLLFTAVAFGLTQVALAVTPTTTVPPLILSGKQSTHPAGTYSPGVSEILKLLDAKVDAPVILAYIQNSPVPYDPEATELIALKEHGASTETLLALLHHGDELRLQLSQAQSAANPPPTAPANGYGPEEAYPPYPYGYPDSSYAPYPASDYSYAPGWPLAWGPSVGISAFAPYWHAHGRYYRRGGYQVGDGGHRDWLSAARPTPYAPQSVSALRSGHTSSAVVPSGGSQGAGRSGGRSAGRSR
jgi:hypothetical protein